MANMPKTSKRLVGAWVEIETCTKIEEKYGREDDTSKSIAYVRALEDATRDVILSADAYRKIADEIEANENKRLAKRKGAR